ncbi:hypothetical protein [Streptomyces venezuelae]|uniref:hypothetical protein n=1 Tax=Streptomyces venezuelae TaxID=54571 RepID=UPI00342E8687
MDMLAYGLSTTASDGRYVISTVDLGEKYWDGSRFETMVFDTTMDDEVDSRRYLTPEAAIKGHTEMALACQLIEAALAP